MKETPFLYSVPSGETVSLIEPFHIAIVGQTQFSGKTTLIKRLAKWCVKDGYKILIFDTKETATDYDGVGVEIPPCMRDETDSVVLLGLLESVFKRKISSFYATLSRLIGSDRKIPDIIKAAEELEAKSRSGFKQDACRTIADLLKRLQTEMSKYETVPRLKLKRGINRMVINKFSLEAQQLIVKNAFEDALRYYPKKLIIVLDEAFKFIPQGYSSPATRSILQVTTQGAKTKLFVWIATQYLAMTDKDPLKSCAIKFLGTQDHPTEVKHTLELIPEVKGRFDKDDVMTLGLGHFILVRKQPRDVRIVYLLPDGISPDLGRSVAIGDLKPEEIKALVIEKIAVFPGILAEVPAKKQIVKVPRKTSEDTKKAERLGNIIEVDIRLTKLENRIKEVEAENKELTKENQLFLSTIRKERKDRAKETEKLTFDLRNEKADREKLFEELSNYRLSEKEILKELSEATKIMKKQEEDLVKWKEFSEMLNSMIEFPATIVHTHEDIDNESTMAEIKVQDLQPALQLEVIRTPAYLSNKDLHGRIAILYAEDHFGDKWFGVKEILSGFRKHGWPRNPRISKALTDFTQWGFFTAKKAGGKGKGRTIYQVILTPEQAKEKGLLTVTEKIE